MTSKTNNIILSISLLFLMLEPGISQENKLRYGSTAGDSVNCGVYLSGYREFYKLEIYDLAKEPWSKAFHNCRSSSERMYVDGVSLYRKYIEEAPDGVVREGLIDTLLLIYDRRMENFGDEGNVLGRKGKDLLAYRSSDIEQVQNAYDMLKKSIKIQGLKSQESVLLLFLRAGIALNEENRLNNVQVIEDYIMLNTMVSQLEKRSSRWKRTGAKLDEIIIKQDLLSCESLDAYYATNFEQNKNDMDYLEQMTTLYKSLSCERSDTYLAALENLYNINPGPESAHKLAILFISRDQNEKAAYYLAEAIRGENIDEETRARWYYESALVNLAIEEPCIAIDHARQAIMLKENFGKAYILLGDAFVASRTGLGDDFQQATVFWAAADQYRKAAQIDSSLNEESRQKLDYASAQYPNSEEVFFRDLKDGESYPMEGCINEITTVQVASR